jgi:hypothetical protein
MSNPHPEFEKQESSIRVNRDPLSKVTDSRLKEEKHNFPSISTLRGIHIDFNEQFEKKESWISLSRDSLSNVNDSSFEEEKHDFPRI